MGKPKKTEYGDDEKKGFSQARNLGVKRVFKKVKEQGGITGHKVGIKHNNC